MASAVCHPYLDNFKLKVITYEHLSTFELLCLQQFSLVKELSYPLRSDFGDGERNDFVGV